MPMDRSRYPQNWDAIARQVKDDANWTCQECGRPCRRPGESSFDFSDRIATNRLSECPVVAEFAEKPQRFTLTVAHLDHDPENPNARLKAMCSGCHLRYDAPMKAQQRSGAKYRQAEKQGQQSLELQT